MGLKCPFFSSIKVIRHFVCILGKDKKAKQNTILGDSDVILLLGIVMIIVIVTVGVATTAVLVILILAVFIVIVVV